MRRFSGEIGMPRAEEFIDLRKQDRGVEHDAIADEAHHARPKDADGEQMRRVFLVPDAHGMPGVGPAAIADDDVGVLGEEIDDLSFAFIAPLQADDAGISFKFTHGSFSKGGTGVDHKSAERGVSRNDGFVHRIVLRQCHLLRSRQGVVRRFTMMNAARMSPYASPSCSYRIPVALSSGPSIAHRGSGCTVRHSLTGWPVITSRH